jgi:hypothetical protein
MVFRRFKAGFKASLKGAFVGVILSVVFSTIKQLTPTYTVFVDLFLLLNLVGSVLLITKLKYWGSGYLVGYLFAIWVMNYFGLIETWLVMLYAVVGVAYIIIRFSRKM